MRRDWEQIASRVRQRGMILRLSSNGHLVNDAVLSKLLELETEQLALSVDGLRETHDRTRHFERADVVRSSFDLVMKTLDGLRETPIISNVITSVTKENLAQLPALHEKLKEHGVQRWFIQLAHRTGRLATDPGEENRGPTPITPQQLPRVADFIVANARDSELAPIAFHSIGYLSGEEPVIRNSGFPGRLAIWRGCQCGINTVGIEPDGGIKGCANQVGEPFVVGNIREESIGKIWNDRARWHWLNPTAEKMGGACAECSLNKHCAAGCTALALSTTGELFNNPYCLRTVKKMRTP
jgi:radical SAM protein with 4Fe4S-binding SPASM domain